ncbi:MAG: polyphenol oxidase family protein [Thermoleophilia bacterium]
MSTAAGREYLAAIEGRIDPSARDLFTVVAPASVPLLVAKTPERFVAAFTTKLPADVAGAANEPFDLSPGRGTEPRPQEGVRRSLLRAALATLAQAPAPSLVSPAQIHGVRVVGTAEYARGPRDSGCDGLTVQPGLDSGLAALLVFADCVPVILLSEVDGAVLHGGWRGLLGGVVQQGAAAMTAPPGLAIIGPSIGPCCYEVSEELALDFERRYGEGVVPSTARLDLWEVATRAACEVGVPRERVVNPRLCTVCNHDMFFSHRADPAGAGRHGAVLWCPDRGEESGMA